MINRCFIACMVVLISTNIGCTQPSQHTVYTGVDVLQKNDFRLLKGQRVGLVTNPTGVNRSLKSTIDLFNDSENVNLVALYGPEHGVRGDYSAGDKVSTYTDPKTGVPVYSLYGSTRKPTSEMLEAVDVLVYDIQDIGVRSYTYISTLGLVLEAAAENNVKVIVLDRPNPLGGVRIEGNVTEEGYFSFVSQFPIPYVYGLTVGELALMMNEEGWLKKGVRADLQVIPMEGWQRSMIFPETGLEWVPTSPHIPHMNSPFYYVTSGIMGELGVLSEGVGYTLPFQLFAAEWIDASEMAERMNALGLKGVTFRPVTYKPYYGRDEGKTLHGVQTHISDPDLIQLMTIQFYFMQVHHELYPEKDPFASASDERLRFFDLVVGTDEVRKRFSGQFKVSDIIDYLGKDVESFRKRSSKYHLYD